MKKTFSLLIYILSAVSLFPQAGSLITSFGNGGIVTTPFGSNNLINACAVQTDGKLVVVGTINDNRFILERYNIDGTIDPTFGGDGRVETNFESPTARANAVAIQSDGRIVVAGQLYLGFTYDFVVVRYNTDGSLDLTFDGDGISSTNVGNIHNGNNAVAIQSDGKIIAGGAVFNVAFDWDFAVVRFNSDGSIDNSFDEDGKVITSLGPSREYINAIAIQPDGKIIAAGNSISNLNGPDEYFTAITRYNSDGSLDNSFDDDGKTLFQFGLYGSFIASLALQNDGKLVVAGNGSIDSGPDYAIARFLPSGLPDLSFGNNGQVLTSLSPSEDYISSIALLPNGQILAGGYAINNNSYDFAIARYSSTGSLDQSFGNNGKLFTDLGSNDIARAMAVYDNRAYLCGYSNGNVAIAAYSVHSLPQPANYRTKANGNWTSASIWEIYNGTDWENSTTFPGQFSNAGEVLVSYAVTLNTELEYNIGSLTITNATVGRLSLGDNGTPGSISVTGNLTINSGTSLTVTNNAQNIISLSGDLTNHGTFNPGSGAVIFNGNTQKVSGSGITFYNLTMSVSDKLIILPYISVKNLILQSGKLAGSNILNPANSTLNSGVNIQPSGTIQATGGSIDEDWFFPIRFFNGTSVTGNITFTRPEILGAVDFGSNSKIGGWMLFFQSGSVVTNPPYYLPGSNLIYMGGTFARGLEWSNSIGMGYPAHVSLQYNTTLNMGLSVAQCSGGLFVQNGSTLNMGSNPHPVIVGGSTCYGTINMSTSPTGDLHITGGVTGSGGFDISPDGIFNSNNRKVFIEGSVAGATQFISSANPNNNVDLILAKTSGSIVSNTFYTGSSGPSILYLNSLTFSSANVSNLALGAKLIIKNGSPEAITRDGSGYVWGGDIQRAISTGGSFLYPIGDQFRYAPLIVAFNNVTSAGNLTASTTVGENSNIASSNIDASKSVNRTWKMIKDNTLTFSSYDITLNYNLEDHDNSTFAANYILGKYDGSTWSYPTLSDIPTTTSVSAIDLSGFGEFAVGASKCTSPSNPLSGSNSPICAGSTLNLTSAGIGTIPLNYSWSGPNGFNSTDQNPSINDASTAASGIYIVTISNACGSIQHSTSVIVNEAFTFYQDNDGDGFGNPSVSLEACTQPQEYVTNNIDCNDDDVTIYPGAPEICDGKDNNCDGNIDGIVTITSFTPLSATVGSTITIQGSNFQDQNTIIYFGAVKAQINSISETAIEVTVPAGATYDHISVTSGDCHLTAYSNKKFTPVFDCNAPLNANAFATKVDFATSTQPQFTTITDFDGDGKPDLGLTQNYLTVFKNTSTNSVINSGTLAPSFDLNSGQVPYGIESADIDGDGKKDILVASMNSNIFSVYRNMSTTGSLTNGSFAPRVNFTTVTNPAGIAVSDIDLDGKPDVVVTNSQEPFSVSVFRNTSTPGNISFAAKVDLALNGQSYFIKMADLDDDGRPEIIAINTFVSSTIQIFRNLSNPGTIDASSFAAPVSLSTGSSARQPDIADLDGDGKLDIIAPNQDNNNFSVYRNVSTTGTISFAPRVNVSSGSNPISAKCGDIDGDGKVDVVIANIAGHTISVYKNNSTPGTLSFGAPLNFSTGVNPYSANIADLDLDGKPEVIVANYTGKTISIFKNQINALAAPVIIASQANPICPGTTALLGTSIEYASYLWSNGATTSSIDVGEGTYTVTVTDVNGCQNSSSYTVISIDDILPTIQCPENKNVNVTPGTCAATVNLDATASDNCSVSLKHYLNHGQQNQTEILSPYVFSVGTRVVTVVATDAGNNTTSCSFSVTVVDNEPPVIPATPPDVIVNTDPGQCTASNVNLGGLNASDNCQIIAEIHNAPAIFPIGTTVVRRRVFDAEGNEAGVNQNVIVVDNQPPTVVIAPQNITVNTDLGQCSASNVSLGNNVSFTDNCPGTTVTNNAPSIYPKGVTTVKWTATDASGNTTTINQTVTVVDNESPYLVCPSNITVNNNPGQCGKQVFYNIDFSDNCNDGGVWTNAGPGSFFPVGTTTVNLIATDGSGNQTSCSFTVTVMDNESPVITSCPSNQTLCYVASGTYSISPLTATDNCIVSSVSYVITGATSRNGNSSDASGIFNPGTSVINWTVTDGSGNTSSCSTTIVIDKVDVTIPDVFPANINASIGSPNTIYVGYGGSSVTLTAQVSSTANLNSYTYKWTIGSPGGPSIGTGPTLTVSPTATTVYYVSIKDAYDCKPLYQVTKQINVIDIRCGNGKIYVCKFKNGAYTTNCIQATTNNVNNLGAGSYLGQCTSQLITTKQPALDEVKPIDRFTVDVYPNPSASSFNVIVQSPDMKENIQLKVINIAGQLIETKNTSSGQTLRLGENYRPGSYVIQAIQGNQRKTIKVVKLSD